LQIRGACVPPQRGPRGQPARRPLGPEAQTFSRRLGFLSSPSAGSGSGAAGREDGPLRRALAQARHGPESAARRAVDIIRPVSEMGRLSRPLHGGWRPPALKPLSRKGRARRPISDTADYVYPRAGLPSGLAARLRPALGTARRATAPATSAPSCPRGARRTSITPPRSPSRPCIRGAAMMPSVVALADAARSHSRPGRASATPKGSSPLAALMPSPRDMAAIRCVLLAAKESSRHARPGPY